MKITNGIKCASALFLTAALPVAAGPAAAEIVVAAPGHMTLKSEGVSPLAPQALWERLVMPSAWWSPDHTYSGDAGNLSLEARAGGLWREQWADGDVAHGTVLMVKPGEALRLAAPFGPLQGMAVQTVLTFTLTPEEGGTRVTLDFVANGSPQSALDAMAGPVDGVFAAGLERLVTAD